MRLPRFLLPLFPILVLGVACGSERPADRGSGGATGGTASGGMGTGGAAGTAGTGGGGIGTGGAAGTGGGGAGTGGEVAGRGGAGGAGGTSAATCPAVPPQPGGNCTGGLNCYYEDCAGPGRTIATCVVGSAAAPRWQVTTGACTAVTCPNPSSLTCPAGQLCFVSAGGAVLVACGNNDCGTSPISCDCLQSCGGVCTVLGSVQDGIAVSCNSCPQGGCP